MALHARLNARLPSLGGGVSWEGKHCLVPRTVRFYLFLSPVPCLPELKSHVGAGKVQDAQLLLEDLSGNS